MALQAGINQFLYMELDLELSPENAYEVLLIATTLPAWMSKPTSRYDVVVVRQVILHEMSSKFNLIFSFDKFIESGCAHKSDSDPAPCEIANSLSYVYGINTPCTHGTT